MGLKVAKRGSVKKGLFKDPSNRKMSERFDMETMGSINIHEIASIQIKFKSHFTWN